MNQKRLLLKVYTKGYYKAKELSSIDDYLTCSLNSFPKGNGNLHDVTRHRGFPRFISVIYMISIAS